jgi:transglutaminase-like putative cysteine protease
VVEATNQLGITLRRVAFEMAFENWRLEAAALAAVREAASGGIDQRSVIAAGITIPRRELVSLRARITAPALNRFHLDGGRQRLIGNEVTIQTEQADRLRAGYTMPVDGTHRFAFRETLGDELLLQLRSQPIVRLSAQIAKRPGATVQVPSSESSSQVRTVPGAVRRALDQDTATYFERDPRMVVERLTRWVHDSLRKVASSSVPNALVVLTSRRGDANEHTQLFTAVARQLGIPTRVAVGLVLVGGKFYYHAWPEVYLGDWVAADPTFGQFPVGATHLRLMWGGLERQAELLRLLPTLHIEVLEAR